MKNERPKKELREKEFIAGISIHRFFREKFKRSSQI